MACPSLEKHFEVLDQRIGDIDDLKRYGDQENPERRYSFLDPYAEKLKYTFRGAILATLGRGVEIPTNDLLGELRDGTYDPGLTSFYKIVNILRLMDSSDVGLGLDYASGLLDQWGPEHDKDRIFPRYYVHKILNGEEVPLWVFELSRNLDVSYLNKADKCKFLCRLGTSPGLQERVAGMTHFNIGLEDYEDVDGSRMSLFDSNNEPYFHEDFGSDNNYFTVLTSVLESMQSIRHLNLSGIICNGRILQAVDSCPNKENIESLNLSYCLMAEELQLVDNSGLSSLKDFSARGVIDPIRFNLDRYKFMRSLRRLDLSDCHIRYSDSFSSQILAGAGFMEELVLERSRLDGFSTFSLNIPRLKRLFMTEAMLLNVPGAGACNLPSLEDLRVDGVTGFRSVQIWETPKLEHLKCTHQADGGINDLVSKFGNLVSLDLQSNDEAIDISLVARGLSGKIRYLNLPRSTSLMFSAGFRTFWEEVISRCTSLEALGVGNETNLLFESEEGGGPLVFGLSKLTELDCRWTGGLPSCIDEEVGVTGMDLEYFGLGLPGIGTFSVPIPDSLKVFRCRDLRTAKSTCVFLDNEDRTSFASDNFVFALCGDDSRVQGYSTSVGIPAGIIEEVQVANPRLQYFSYRLAAEVPQVMVPEDQEPAEEEDLNAGVVADLDGIYQGDDVFFNGFNDF